MKKSNPVKNIAASVTERLRNVSIKSNRDFQSVIRQFIQERFLFRLSISGYSDKLILKGALLFVIYNAGRSRPTKDIDFLGTSISNDAEEVAKMIKEILTLDCGDGVAFAPDSVETEDIAEGKMYHGVRIKFLAYIQNIRERIQLDIGFGDVIISGPLEMEFPVLLDFPAPKLKVYRVESAIAEKFEAIVSLQLMTSRMKDFYDILYFAENFQFESENLRDAILSTFHNRNTDIEDRKIIFKESFKEDARHQNFWTAFLTRSNLLINQNFSQVIDRIQSFIEPVFTGKKRIWDPHLFIWK